MLTCNYSSGQTAMATQVWAKLHTQTMSQQEIHAVSKWSCQVLTGSKPHHHTFHCPSPTAALSWNHQTHKIDLTESKLACVLPINAIYLNHLYSRFLSHQCCCLAVGLHACLMTQSKYTLAWAFNHHEIYCLSKQTSIAYMYIYMNMCNAVTQVWRSLRLATPN